MSNKKPTQGNPPADYDWRDDLYAMSPEQLTELDPAMVKAIEIAKLILAGDENKGILLFAKHFGREILGHLELLLAAKFEEDYDIRQKMFDLPANVLEQSGNPKLVKAVELAKLILAKQYQKVKRENFKLEEQEIYDNLSILLKGKHPLVLSDLVFLTPQEVAEIPDIPQESLKALELARVWLSGEQQKVCNALNDLVLLTMVIMILGDVNPKESIALQEMVATKRQEMLSDNHQLMKLWLAGFGKIVAEEASKGQLEQLLKLLEKDHPEEAKILSRMLAPNGPN